MHRAKRRRTTFTVEDEHENLEAEGTHEDDVNEYPGQSDGSEYEEQEKRTHRHGRRSLITARVTRATRSAMVQQTGRETADRDRDLDGDREDVDDENGGARRRRLTVYDTVAAGRRTVGTRTAQALAMAGADAAMGRRVYRGANTMPAADEVLGSRAARVLGRGWDEGEEVAEDASFGAVEQVLGGHYAALAGLQLPPSVSLSKFNSVTSTRTLHSRANKQHHRNWFQ
ncbi:uncharacterized protein V1513DRAFT_424928 [Lipomyces chichibuensis]|uniref:uncharacterized protein n=1 Tax=Lipomyces chichibuensis TaxID=1546026 RepID=UPI003343A556